MALEQRLIIVGTTAEQAAIVAPQTNTLFFNLTTNVWQRWNGAIWVGADAAAATPPPGTINTICYFDATGNFTSEADFSYIAATNSLRLGTLLTTTGSGSIVVGSSHSGNAVNSFILGTSHSAATQSAIVIGNSNTAVSNSTGSFIGGESNSYTGTVSVMIVGDNHIVSGNHNIIGGTTNTNSGTSSIVSGENNNNAGSRCIVAGNSNIVPALTLSSLVIGTDNTLVGNCSHSIVTSRGGSNTLTTVAGCIVSSYISTISSTVDSLVLGSVLTVGSTAGVGISVIAGSSLTLSGITESLVIGQGHSIPFVTDSIQDSMIVGSSHILPTGSGPMVACGLIGTGLLLPTVTSSVVVGSYNENAGTNKRFTVGIGTGVGTRRDGLYVTTDGDVNIFRTPRINEGANKAMGIATLIGGTLTVANTLITANTRIMLTGQNNSGTAGELTISARTVGTDFTITSTSGTDTRDVAWILFEPGT